MSRIKYNKIINTFSFFFLICLCTYKHMSLEKNHSKLSSFVNKGVILTMIPSGPSVLAKAIHAAVEWFALLSDPDNDTLRTFSSYQGFLLLKWNRILETNRLTSFFFISVLKRKCYWRNVQIFITEMFEYQLKKLK